MHEASSEVGSTAKTRPACSAASVTRRVTTPASVSTVAISTSPVAVAVAPVDNATAAASGPVTTGPIRSSFSVLITAARGVSGTAPPV